MILNREFPRSISYNLSKVHENLIKISNISVEETDSVEFEAGKLATFYRYLTVTEILEKGLLKVLNETLGKIYHIGDLIEARYFN